MRVRHLAKLLPIAVLTLIVSVAVVHADDSARQIIKIGSETLYVPVDWLAQHVSLDLVSGEHIERVPPLPDGAPYEATDVVLGQVSFHAPDSAETLLPFWIHIEAITPIAAANYQAMEVRNARIEQQARTVGQARPGDIRGHGATEIVVGSANAYKLDAPLAILATTDCENGEILLDRASNAEFRIAPLVHVKITFDCGKIPPAKWLKLDTQLEKLFRYLRTDNGK